jgi:hypothetical protein
MLVGCVHQLMQRPGHALFLKNIKNVGIKLASLKSMFQYKSNITNFTRYYQILVALFIRLKFALECVCALSIPNNLYIIIKYVRFPSSTFFFGPVYPPSKSHITHSCHTTEPVRYFLVLSRPFFPSLFVNDFRPKL